MAITAKEVNELRKQTGAGLMDCKKALTEANGDMDTAIDYLRKKGQKVAELRAGRDAKEGAVIAVSSGDKSTGAIVHLSCETDFVARNDEFVGFAKDLANLVLDKELKTKEELLAADYEGVTVQEKLTEKVGAIGENISVSNFARLEAECVVPYIHAGNKIGVLIGLNKDGNDKIVQTGRDLAMQIAAMNPVSLDESNVPEEVKEREIAIGREQAIAEGKPENIVDKIAQGKLTRFYKDNTLVNQAFVKDGSKNVKQVLSETENGLEITDFKRVALA